MLGGSPMSRSNIQGWCCTSPSGAAWPAVHTKHQLTVDMPESKNMRITRDERRLLFKDMWPDSVTKWGFLPPFRLLNTTFSLLRVIQSVDPLFPVILSVFCVILSGYLCDQKAKFSVYSNRFGGVFPRCTRAPVHYSPAQIEGSLTSHDWDSLGREARVSVGCVGRHV